MTFKCTCTLCGKTFPAKRSTAKFCCSTCRSKFRYHKNKKKEDQAKKLSKGETTIKKLKKEVKVKKEVKSKDLEVKSKEIDYSPSAGFVPNWKKAGFKNKEEGVLYALGLLMKNASNLKKIGLTDTVTIIWKGRVIRI